VAFTGAPALPDTFPEVFANGLTFKSIALVPGTYYACVRAKDRFGRWSGTYASVGPYLIKSPDPADLVCSTLPGWFRPVVPTPSGSSTAFSVVAPTSLPGNSGIRWNASGANNGQTGTGITHVYATVDGDSVDHDSVPGVASDGTWTLINETGVAVRGGRHTFGAIVDGPEAIAETNEVNNAWARQWSWSGLTVSSSTLLTRGAAPYRVGGHDDIAAGEAIYVDSDGLRFTSTGWWNAVWAYATDLDDDTDVRLHFPSTNVDTAFTKSIATSQRGAGYLDAVLVNRNVTGSLPWDVGVVNYSGGASSFRAKHVTSNSFVFGDSADVGFPADEFVTLHDLYVGAGNLGDVLVTLRTAPGAPTAHVQWLDRTFTYGPLSAYVQTAATDSTGTARFVVNAAAAAYYGVVCYRDPKDGAGAAPFTLQVERAPADLAAFTPAGWYSPVVPRPATDGTFASVPMPSVLNSTPQPTYFNMAAKNIGTIAAPPTSSWMQVDGVLAATYGYPTWNAGQQMLFNSTYAVYIRGGRHTLSHVLDGDDLVPELVDANNQYGEQYAWSPLALAIDTPLTRTAPPDRTAGWTDVSNGDALYFNSDGFRTPAAPPSGGLHSWSAVAVLPSATADVDLRIHEIIPGTKAAFANPLATSVWADGQSDFVIANFNSTPYRQFDVGAVRWEGTDAYTVQATTSTRRTLGAGGELGTFTQGANDLLDLHEVWLTPGVWAVTCETVAGAANLGVSVHGATALQGKSAALALAWLEPAGVAETASLTVANAGWFCIAVWKTAGGDLAQSATYRLAAQTGTLAVGDDVPGTVEFGLPQPNPSSATSTLGFALPRDGHVSVAVYDVTGARVRSLVDGERTAGRHHVTWDGRTDAGGRAPAGLYYVRFVGGGATASRKVVRIE